MSSEIERKFLLPSLSKDQISNLAPEKLLEFSKALLSEEKLKELIPAKDFEHITSNNISHDELVKLLKKPEYCALRDLFRAIKIEKISKILKETLPLLPDEHLKNATFFEIEQSYLDSPDSEENRVRAINNKIFVKTVKIPISQLERKENERPISKEDYYKYLNSKIGNTLEKMRCQFRDGDITYQIDIYTDENLAGVVIVEVEFPTKKHAENFKAPDWFGTEIKRKNL
jgi:CYTH domain-containing protein